MKQMFYIQGNIEVVKNGQPFLNRKRVTLLKLIIQKGSIRSASMELKMSYQQAWHFINEMNELSPLPLIVRQRGGANGGGAMVTSFGKRAIEEFERLDKAHDLFKKELGEHLDFCFF